MYERETELGMCVSKRQRVPLNSREYNLSVLPYQDQRRRCVVSGCSATASVRRARKPVDVSLGTVLAEPLVGWSIECDKGHVRWFQDGEDPDAPQDESSGG